MINRRKFLKTMSAASASVFIPSSLNLTSLYKHANAAVDYAGATIAPPAVMPQVINIFLYGGPSELAGNLSNIVDIENNSQNSYEAAFDGITRLTTDPVDPGLITPNGFWSGAGGDEMEFLVNPGAGTNPYMTVYRTLMKRKDGTRSHRESILMSLKGSLDIETSAGVGTRMAALLYQQKAAYEASSLLADGSAITRVEDMLLPFVSFEGDSRIYAPDPDVTIPLLLRGTTLDNDFDNPFTRNNNGSAATMDALVNKVTGAAEQARFAGVVDSFVLREFLETKIAALDTANAAALPTLTDANDIAGNGGNATFTYPNNSFGQTVKAAVTLAIENPTTLFLSLGGALGGWDDHNNGIDRYPGRMTSVMETLKAAMWQIKLSQGKTIAGGATRINTDNIVINVFGDFGRRVNLNNSQGWDHGNNQNLFTLGGSGVVSAGNTGGPAARTLGKVVGTTVRVGDSGTNNQFTNPAPGSYEFEPMSVAASVYSYMGVQNPQVVTADPEMNPSGDPAINENAT
jgi:hypothetical protein